MNSNKFVETSFTNEFGQIINVNDDVIYIGSGYNHSVKIKKGKFGGVYIGKVYKHGEYKEEIVAVQVKEIPEQKRKYDYVDGKYQFIEEYTEYRKAILPLKRVYKLDVSLISFINKSL